MSYVAYVHAKPDTEDASGIFYVGKGLERRARKVVRNESSNRHYKHTVAKYGAENIMVGMLPCSTETIAFDLEKGLIKCLRRMGVELTNMTDGGEGSSGYTPTKETRQKASENSRSNWKNVEFRTKTVLAQTQAQRTMPTSEAKRKAALENAVLGRLILATEKKEESAKKNSEKSLINWSDPTFRAETIAAQKAVWTEEKRAAKGDEIRGRVRVTNGTDERNVPKAEVESLLLAGWWLGRKPRKSSKRAKSNLN